MCTSASQVSERLAPTAAATRCSRLESGGQTASSHLPGLRRSRGDTAVRDLIMTEGKLQYKKWVPKKPKSCHSHKALCLVACHSFLSMMPKLVTNPMSLGTEQIKQLCMMLCDVSQGRKGKVSDTR